MGEDQAMITKEIVIDDLQGKDVKFGTYPYPHHIHTLSGHPPPPLPRDHVPDRPDAR